MQEDKCQLTECQCCWLGHVRVCTDAGNSMLEYSNGQGFSTQAVYAGIRKLLRTVFYPVHRRHSSNV